MSHEKDTEVRFQKAEQYRDDYANSVQVRMSVWDFQLTFGTMQQDSPNEVTLTSFQGIYLSPQQAKALAGILNHNVAQYESAFGKIALEPNPHPGPQVVPFPQGGGPVN